MVWSQMKHYCPRKNIYTNEPLKVLDLICEVCSTKISPKNWESFLLPREEEKFRKTDHIDDNGIEPVIIKYSSLSESDSDSDVKQ